MKRRIIFGLALGGAFFGFWAGVVFATKAEPKKHNSLKKVMLKPNTQWVECDYANQEVRQTEIVNSWWMKINGGKCYQNRYHTICLEKIGGTKITTLEARRRGSSSKYICDFENREMYEEVK